MMTMTRSASAEDLDLDQDQDQDEWTPQDPDADASFAGARRRWGGAVLALLLMLMGAAGAVWLASDDSGRSVEVVTLARPLVRGAVVTPSDLAVVRVDVSGGGVRVATPTAARQTLVGRQALVDLAAGTLLSPEMVGSVVLTAGQMTLGVSIGPEGLPSAALRPGERVSVLGSSPFTSELAVLARGVTVTDVWQQTGAGQSGETVVYLALSEQAAVDVATAASSEQGVRLLGAGPAPAGDESADAG